MEQHRIFLLQVAFGSLQLQSARLAVEEQVVHFHHIGIGNGGASDGFGKNVRGGEHLHRVAQTGPRRNVQQSLQRRIVHGRFSRGGANRQNFSHFRHGVALRRHNQQSIEQIDGNAVRRNGPFR